MSNNGSRDDSYINMELVFTSISNIVVGVISLFIGFI